LTQCFLKCWTRKIGQNEYNIIIRRKEDRGNYFLIFNCKIESYFWVKGKLETEFEKIRSTLKLIAKIQSLNL